MNRLLRHFKLPLIVTGIALVVMTVVAMVLDSVITQSGAANAEERRLQLGPGLGMLTTLIIGPFWIYAVLQSGKERREELKQINFRRSSGPARKKRKK